MKRIALGFAALGFAFSSPVLAADIAATAPAKSAAPGPGMMPALFQTIRPRWGC